MIHVISKESEKQEDDNKIKNINNRITRLLVSVGLQEWKLIS